MDVIEYNILYGRNQRKKLEKFRGKYKTIDTISLKRCFGLPMNALKDIQKIIKQNNFDVGGERK